MPKRLASVIICKAVETQKRERQRQCRITGLHYLRWDWRCPGKIRIWFVREEEEHKFEQG